MMSGLRVDKLLRNVNMRYRGGLRSKVSACWISIMVFPKKRHVSLTPTEKCVFNARSEAGKTLLVVR